MRAVRASEPGDASVLRVEAAPVPRPGPGEVLIEVAASGLNRLDLFQRQGSYPPPPGASDILGLEVAGTVVAIGQGVGDVAIGDRVCALLQGGGYADYCVAPAALCLPVPDGWSLVEAASLPEALFTVWSNVFMRAAIAPGESLLVQGGASGIGTAAIQLATAFGHEVYATAGSDEKCHACEALGARRAVNYRQADFERVVKDATAGRGVDVILDMVGGSYIPRELRTLADDGRLCLIAFLDGAKTEVNLAEMLRRRLTLTASTLRPRNVAFKATIAHALHERVWPLLKHRTVEPQIWATHPLERVAQAHQQLESGEHIGKIVLTLR
ncbi:NAD(P)H-quinone oxidoreductase [Chitinivorax sp. PXF-14]|uniref:NAD(P)H-quinone oxidoreductase n=1 Tax=Chitinivorax sp. PXF-14 TaxID=3230488 RepID=UPI003465241C